MAVSVSRGFCPDETMFNEFAAFRPDSWQKAAMKPVLPYFDAIGMDQLAMIAAGKNAWTLLAMSIDILRPLRLEELLTLTMTGIRREGLLYRVETEVTGPDGDRAALCTTFYAQFDFSSRRICRDEAILSRFPEGIGEPRMRADSRRKADTDGFVPVLEQVIPASWMDMVGHANNTRYGELCYNGMTKQEQQRLLQLRRLEFYFTGEVNEGETLSLRKRTETEGSLAFAGIRGRDGKQSFLMYAEF